MVTLLQQARTALAEADWELDPGEKFSHAYLAALRAGAAMLALRGRPHRGRARPTSVWVLLTSVAPELSEWAKFFAAGSSTRAAVQAGITRQVSQCCADDLARQAAQFLAIVERAMREDRRERILR
ncbi:MAG: SAV_6107 family HEPN domain-containing protein [Sciscionella sp.]